ncbi:MAG: hypothetical protein VX527_01620 [Planctomycetota bacterium]|nr:hypothetical protein [Planctomycetota bacterium]
MILLAYILSVFTMLSVTDAEPMAEATRGIAGRVTIEVDQGMLRGRPDLDLDSPLLVRIAAVQPRPEGGFLFDLEFLGTQPGVFDLRDVLVFSNGASTAQLDPIPIRIVSHLADHSASDLAMTIPPESTLRGGYVTVLIVIGVAWILVPVIVITRRLLRPRPVPISAPRGPTLAEQLAPLVEAAADRQLTIPEQARLELLLYWYWQAALQLDESRPEAVARLRRHDDAGQLLRTVESWLHDPATTAPTRDDIKKLLLPYRQVPAGAVS